MADNWEAAINFVLDMEGRTYENDIQDPGGATKFGISQRAYPSLDILNLTQEQAEAIYRKDYWEVCACDQLPPKIAIAVFDCAVNQGPTKAKRLLQICLDVLVDADIGPLTISAAHKADEQKILVMYLARRAADYVEIILHNQTLKVYELNWMRRLFKLASVTLNVA